MADQCLCLGGRASRTRDYCAAATVPIVEASLRITNCSDHPPLTLVLLVHQHELVKRFRHICALSGTLLPREISEQSSLLELREESVDTENVGDFIWFGIRGSVPAIQEMPSNSRVRSSREPPK